MVSGQRLVTSGQLRLRWPWRPLEPDRRQRYHQLYLGFGRDQTQVLADGEITYLYGLGRIAQQNATSTDYFLADVLGSVRQMV